MRPPQGLLSPPLRCWGSPGCALWAGTLAAPASQGSGIAGALLGRTGIHWRKDWDCKAGWSRGRGLGVGLIPETQIALIISQDCEGK